MANPYQHGNLGMQVVARQSATSKQTRHVASVPSQEARAECVRPHRKGMRLALVMSSPDYKPMRDVTASAPASRAVLRVIAVSSQKCQLTGHWSD